MEYVIRIFDQDGHAWLHFCDHVIDVKLAEKIARVQANVEVWTASEDGSYWHRLAY